MMRKFLSTEKAEKNLVGLIVLLFTLVMTGLAIWAKGTGDDGDAIAHYLFPRHAFQHPENFLDHWAKPVFVLITAPVAQLGFEAMKIFNVLLMAGCMWLTWLSAKKLQLPNAWFVVIPFVTAPENIQFTLSGLTEPMFAFWLIAGIYLILKERWWQGVLWLSFLPFVRSEGLIVFCLVLPYLLLKGRWKEIPLLATGHVVYSLIGFLLYRDFLWVFNRMPYATLKEAYGSGPLTHFVDKLPNLIGAFLAILLVIGLLYGLVKWVRFLLGKTTFSKEEIWLVYGIFLANFVGHSVFWYLGIFNSFGLLRVLVGVMPMLALIMLRGNNVLIDFAKKLPIRIAGLVQVGIVAACFWVLSANIGWYELDLNPPQKTHYEAAQKYGEKYRGYTLYFDAIYPALAFDVDWFDPAQHRRTPQLFTGEPIPEKSLVIWDDWFSADESNIPLDTLTKDPRFELLDSFEAPSGDKVRKAVVFLYHPPAGNKNILFKNDFEGGDLLNFHDTTLVYAGKRSGKFDRNHEYSPGFDGSLNSFQNEKTSKVRLRFWAYAPQLPGEGEGAATAVISFENLDKPFLWRGEKLMPKLTAASWQEIVVEQPIEKMIAFNDRLKVYIWNPGDLPLFIDDMTVEWIND